MNLWGGWVRQFNPTFPQKPQFGSVASLLNSVPPVNWLFDLYLHVSCGQREIQRTSQTDRSNRLKQCSACYRHENYIVSKYLLTPLASIRPYSDVQSTPLHPYMLWTEGRVDQGRVEPLLRGGGSTLARSKSLGCFGIQYLQGSSK